MYIAKDHVRPMTMMIQIHVKRSIESAVINLVTRDSGPAQCRFVCTRKQMADDQSIAVQING